MYLTKRQKEILDYLKGYREKHGYSPTFEEIAVTFGFSSKGTVYKHVRTLKEKGFIRHAWNRTRSIEIQGNDPYDTLLPVLGLVSAGKPIEAVESTEEMKIPHGFIRRGNHYILRVVGNSMIEECIADGDYIVVQEKRNAENGETVVALLDNSDVTIKRLFKRDGTIELRPANDRLESLFLESDKVQIQGVVVGVLRRYPTT